MTGPETALRQVLRPAAGANRPRWDGRSPGHYEVWYLTLNDPATGRGFWFRYTLEVPAASRRRPPTAELWGFVFTAGAPASGAKETVPLEWPPRGVMHVGERGRLEDGRATGSISGAAAGGAVLAWDLTWDPSPLALWHIPGWAGRSRVPSTRVVSPNVAARFDGWVQLGDERLELRAAPGCQTHLWGRQHAARWAWAHCSAFQDDDAALVEAIWAVPLLARGRAAPGGPTLLYVEAGGERFACNAFPWLLRSRSRVDSPRWELRGRTPAGRVRAVLEARPEEMAQVVYEDPDGAQAWCANSEIAWCALEVERPDGSFTRLESPGSAHVEFGAREPDARVPVLV